MRGMWILSTWISFDKVLHQWLLRKLGISGKVLSWISWISDRQQHAVLYGEALGWVLVTLGVLQESVGSNLLHHFHQ